MMSEQLKPCPFCGEAFGICASQHDVDGDWMVLHYCFNGTEIAVGGFSQADAEMKWNARADCGAADTYRMALEDIMKHQRAAAGGCVEMSVTYHLAEKALARTGYENLNTKEENDD